MCNRPKETHENLGRCKVGLLASHALEIPSLFKPALECFDGAFKLLFGVKDGEVKDSVLPRFGRVFNYLVDLLIDEKSGSAGSTNTCSLGCVILQNFLNFLPWKVIKLG